MNALDISFSCNTRFLTDISHLAFLKVVWQFNIFRTLRIAWQLIFKPVI